MRQCVQGTGQTVQCHGGELQAFKGHGLETVGWSFADRKRFLDHFLASGRSAQGVAPNASVPCDLHPSAWTTSSITKPTSNHPW